MNKQETYEMLKSSNIHYEAFEHPPAYNMEEIGLLALPYKDKVVKNLFLRDDKGRNYYLVTLAGHKTADLKALSAQIHSRKLSFANEARLEEFLGLEPGSVTPLGILNNEAGNVTAVLDSSLQGQTVGVHPMENTATLFLAFEDLLTLLRMHGGPVVVCEI